MEQPYEEKEEDERTTTIHNKIQKQMKKVARLQKVSPGCCVHVRCLLVTKVKYKVTSVNGAASTTEKQQDYTQLVVFRCRFSFFCSEQQSTTSLIIILPLHIHCQYHSQTFIIIIMWPLHHKRPLRQVSPEPYLLFQRLKGDGGLTHTNGGSMLGGLGKYLLFLHIENMTVYQFVQIMSCMFAMR